MRPQVHDATPDIPQNRRRDHPRALWYCVILRFSGTDLRFSEPPASPACRQATGKGPLFRDVTAWLYVPARRQDKGAGLPDQKVKDRPATYFA